MHRGITGARTGGFPEIGGFRNSEETKQSRDIARVAARYFDANNADARADPVAIHDGAH